MDIKVYNSEYHERGQRRYIIFALFFTSVIVFLLLYKNFIGAILLFFLLGGYFFFSLMMQDEISLTLSDNYLQIGQKILPWSRLQGYALEIDKNTQQLKNIVVVSERDFYIHTIKDTDKEKIRDFIITLNMYIPLLGSLPQSFAEKLRRFLKL